MLKTSSLILISWLILIALFGVYKPAEAGPRITYESDPLEDVARSIDIEPIVWAMSYEGAEGVKVQWGRCGEANAFYFMAHSLVGLCYELIERGDSPEFIQWVVAHEMAHAVVSRKGLPIVGSREVAADELATLVLLWTGRRHVVIGAIEHFINHGLASPYLNPTDEHTHNLQRGFSLLCLLAGMERKDPSCQVKYDRATWAWNVLLGNYAL